MCVSIPYRYATNLKPGNRVKVEWKVSIPYRYATNEHHPSNHDILGSRFQFLIGTLQTSDAKLSKLPEILVSIPYRYATNSFNTQDKIGLGIGFNSL